MMTIEESFLRYRNHGDVKALGDVFDAVAEELALVAAHLMPTGVEAEDLVQVTFVEAIEHAERYDPDKQLTPWLIGILVNHVRRERKRAKRSPPLGTSTSGPTNPLDMAEQQEVGRYISEALNGLPMLYRQVLTLRHLHGLQPMQIAKVLGCPIATCKTRLQRGMQLLRDALPGGIGASLAVVVMTGEGLANCRQFVMAKAATFAVATSATSTFVLTGVAMKKLTVAIVALVFIAAAVVLQSLYTNHTAHLDTGVVAHEESAPSITEASAKPDQSAERSPANGTASNMPISLQRQALTKPDLAGELEEYKLAVLVCDEDGAPVSGAHVVLSRDGSEQLSDREPPPESAGITNAVGMASLLVAPGLTNVAATKVGVGVSAFVWFGRIASVQIKLSTLNAEICGHVVDHLDRGVKNAVVHLTQSSRHRSHRAQPNGSQVGPVRCETRTAVDGSFSFRASRAWGVCAVFARVGRIACRPIETEPGEEGSRHLRIELPGRFVLRGIVLDWRGKPVVACEVYADQPAKGSNAFTESHTVTTNATGKFEMPFLIGGRCEVAPLGTEVLPAGPTVATVLSAAGTGWVELHTTEPATLEGTVVGLIEDQPTRILARPVDDNLAGMRELHSVGNEHFVLRGLMRGVAYNVFVFQGDEQCAEATVIAGETSSITLRGAAMRGNAVLLCEVTGEGLVDLIGTKVMISAHSWDGTAKGKLGTKIVAEEWHPGVSIRLESLPKLPAAVAVVTVDGIEMARSGPLRLSDEPAHAVVKLPENGTIELTATIPSGAVCYAQVRYADGSPILLRGASRLIPSRPFRCTIPSGRYLVRVTTEDSNGSRIVDLPCLVMARETLRLRHW
jgi:RNA polymerase sigma-70 factor (ECF subfamily)